MSGISFAVAAAVLGSAVIHAGWNSIAKFVPGRLVASALLAAGFFLFGGVWTLITPVPAAESWPYLAVSAVLQAGYLLLLTAAYAAGEFRKIYPIARGTAPVVVTIVAITVLGERLGAVQLAGIALVVAALGLLVTLPHRSGGQSEVQAGGRAGLATSGVASSRRGILLAVATGLVIGGYSLVDGVGVRLAGTAAGYTAWQAFLQGPLVIAVCLVVGRPRRLLGRIRFGEVRMTLLGLAGGAASLGAYAIILWAQSRASLALVSALRETSVLLAGVLGALVFRERFGLRQALAAVGVVVGIILIQL